MMAFSDKCYFTEFEADNGWRMRLELLPASDMWPENEYILDRTELAEWEELPEDFTVDFGQISAGFEDLPLGIASFPKFTLKINGEHLSDDLFDCILQKTPVMITHTLNYAPGTESYDQFNFAVQLTNTWILRTDRGSGEDLAEADIYFCGAQNITKSVELEYDENEAETLEIEVENTLAYLLKTVSVWVAGDYVFNQLKHEYTDFLRRQGILYDTLWSETITGTRHSGGATIITNYDIGVSWCETNGDDRAMLVQIAHLNKMILELIRRMIQWWRLPENFVRECGIDPRHLLFYQQNYNKNGEAGTTVFSETFEIAEDYSATFQHLHLILGISVFDNWDLIGGLMIKNGGNGAGFDGETLLDALQNITLGWGAKRIFHTTSKNIHGYGYGLNLIQRGMLGTIYDPQTIDVKEEALSGFKITLGGNSMRSVAFNIDPGGSEDIDEYRVFVGGGQSEEDYEKKMPLHNLPKVAQKTSDFHNTDLIYARQRSFRRDVYSLRQLRYIGNPAIAESGLPDQDIPVRVHDHMSFFDGKKWHYPITELDDPSNPTPLEREQIPQGFKEIQRRSGMPNLIAQAIAEILETEGMALITFTMELSKVTVNHLGGEYFLDFSGLPARYSSLSARAYLINAPGDILAGTAEATFWIIPEEAEE